MNKIIILLFSASIIACDNYKKMADKELEV
jgi:hypothetical protein